MKSWLTASSNELRIPGAEDGDEGDQREADHQRGGGRGGARRVPGRVVARKDPRRAADRLRRRAQHGRERPNHLAARSSRRRRRAACTPTPSSSSRGPVAIPLPSAPSETTTMASTRTTSDVTGRTSPSARPAAPSLRARPRSAARASRVAQAGCSAISVTIVPTSSETTIVRVAKTVDPCGRSMPIATNNPFRPFASARPRKSPIDRAEHADHERLDHHRPHHLPA